MKSHWAHAPLHLIDKAGTYMVTAGTYQKVHYFHRAEYKNYLTHTLFALAKKYKWQLQAWAILSNHYHFVAISPENPESLRDFISEFHRQSATIINRLDNCVGRKVWYQFWDSQITYQKSYFSRLKYVHNNAVHHKLVKNAESYPWCSKSWFNETADSALINTVESFKIDRLNVFDNF
ncbi:MAG: transposase [Lentisphaeria bacterium]|nr:transposase [Lentisphaeria bacterium]